METENPQTPETLGVQALDTIKNSHPPQWLAPPPELANNAKTASKYLFSQIVPKAPKCPISSLLTDDFDAEQIWQQIDLQAQPLIASLKKRVKNLDKTSETLSLLVNDHEPKPTRGDQGREVDDADEDSGDEDMDAEVERTVSSEIEESDEQEPEKEEASEDEDENEEDGEKGVLEDRFFKINDLEKFLNEAEVQGLEPPKESAEDDDDESLDVENDDEDDEDDDEDEETGKDFGKGGGFDKSTKYSMYEDFFGGRKKPQSKKHFASDNEPEEMNSGDDDIEMNSGDDEIHDSDQDAEQPTGKSSTHERQKEKIHKKIEQLEKENLETKSWIMQGEVTAARRPKNSALEVELDFVHNTRPAPVITEEVTSSLEDIIKRRIAEEQFDDVQPKPTLPSSAPKEQIKLDENKSEKGLAELYEAEYMQRTGLASAPVSSSDALKNEAALLFKRLCLKLDALSHFQFTPKPVIEDMSIQANVPALAMEEIAPVAISEASMLAPEELFTGEGPVKDEGELTREDRKRLRARKKRKRKAEKGNKAIRTKVQIISKDHDEKQGYKKNKAKDQKLAQTHYGKSSKVFSDLDQAKDKAASKLSQHKTDMPHPSFLKL